MITWTCVFPGSGLRAGDTIDLPDGDGRLVVRGNLALFLQPGAEDAAGLTTQAAAVQLLRDQLGAMTPRLGDYEGNTTGPAGSEDARTLAVKRNSSGERFRDLRSVAEDGSPSQFPDWALQGPRTAHWLIREMAKTGMGPVARHSTWAHENRLNDDDKVRAHHSMLSELLELFCCHDQLDPTNLMGMEALARHLQYTEHEVMRKADAKKPYDNQMYYLGREKRTGGALVSPELTKWVADQAQRDSAILKEQRKAAEERALQRDPPGKKG